MRTAGEPRSNLAREPLIQHFMQVDVGEDGRNTTTLGRASSWILNHPVFHHARLQPLVDKPPQRSVTYPLAHDVPQVTMVQRLEKSPDVNFKDPPARHLHRLALYCSQRLMRRTAGPEAIRTVQKTLLVNCFQHHDHCPLEHLVLEGWNADGPRLRASPCLRDVHSADRRRHVATRLDPLEQRTEIFLQLPRILVGRLPVHPGSSALARAPIRFTQPIAVDVMGERRQCHLWHLARQLCYPLK